jgi:hypothetical protein
MSFLFFPGRRRNATHSARENRVTVVLGSRHVIDHSLRCFNLSNLVRLGGDRDFPGRRLPVGT